MVLAMMEAEDMRRKADDGGYCRKRQAMDKIPPELLCSIFCRCPHSESTFKPGEAPWILGRVCRQWRNLSLNLPELYQTIHLDHHSIQRHFDNAEEIFQIALQRTHGKELRVIFYLPGKYNGLMHEISAIIPAIATLLKPTVDRWTYLEMNANKNDSYHTDTRDLIREISAGSPLAFKSLRSFRFDTTVDSPASSFFAKAFKAASLESASIRATDEYVLTRTLQSSWPWLTHLELSLEWYTNSGIVVLPVFPSRFPRLTFLSIEYVHTSPEVSRLPPIQLPTLHTLRIVCLSPANNRSASHSRPDSDETLELCKLLVLPNLKRLELRQVLGLKQNHHTLFRIVEKLSSTLISLSIEDIGLVDVAIIRLLRFTPCLTELTLKGYLSDTFFDRMRSDAGATIVPRLRDMNVSLVGFSHPFLPHMIGTCLSERAALRTFRLGISSGDMNEAFVRSVVGSVPRLEVFVDYGPPVEGSDPHRAGRLLLSRAVDGLEENLNEVGEFIPMYFS
ncbi:hypothetical protein V5O48_003878 [Marasmius crinis-equi]|uniref:F-box domain-containing protein n=1 Tax=Marasmius crinis-equi TaxID=585013 RepID=A0ABR3FRM3_9AGAR